MKESDLIENKNIREKMIDNISVLEKVKDLLLLPNTNFARIEEVANYYNVSQRHIEEILSSNREELESDGVKIRKADDFISELNIGNKNLIKQRGKFIVKFNEDNIMSFAPRGVLLFPKRAILRIGMLLRDSDIAKQVRTRLLDIEYESNNAIQENEKTVKENIVNEIDEEKSLMLERIEAEMNGDFDKVCVINAKLFALKNKRIKELENKVEDITTHSLTLTESRQIINKLVRVIAIKEYSGMFGKAFGELYKIINYKLGINIKARNKKKTQSYLDTLSEEEMFKTEEIVKNWAVDKGVDINNELGLKQNKTA